MNFSLIDDMELESYKTYALRIKAYPHIRTDIGDSVTEENTLTQLANIILKLLSKVESLRPAPKVETKYNLESYDPITPSNALNKILHEVHMKGHVDHAEWERDDFGHPKALIVYFDYLYPEKDE